MKVDTHNPALALWLVRMGVGGLFLAFGIKKLLTFSMTAGMMGSLFEVSAGLGQLIAIAVIATEIIGGFIILLGKMMPRLLYNIVLLGFAIIIVVGYTTVYIVKAPGFDPSELFWHAQLLLMVFALRSARPMCPIGCSGYKE